MELNEKQAKVLAFIRTGMGELPPTVREICAATGIKSTSSVHTILYDLERMGYIERHTKTSRSIHVSGASRSRQVPLLGQVTAGIPILAVEQVESYIPVPAKLGDEGELFALHVKGLSMKDAGILDGDVIVARKADTAENGDIVVALLGDEATVKRFFRHGKQVRLQPENDAFEPIITREVEILGRVVASMRTY